MQSSRLPEELSGQIAPLAHSPEAWWRRTGTAERGLRDPGDGAVEPGRPPAPVPEELRQPSPGGTGSDDIEPNPAHLDPGYGVMRRQRLLLTISAVASATLWAYACGDGTTEPPAPDPLLPTTVTVSPATATVVEGDTLRLTATATNVYGQAVTGVEFVWASGDTAVAVVDSTGLVTGVGAGQVQVSATAAGLTGRAELAVVAPLPTTVAVMPDTVVLTAVGQTAQLTAEVRDQAGRVMEGVPVVWLSAETTVAAVDTSGLVTAVGGGAVTITATAGEASGDGHVTVAIDLDRVALVALYNATDGPNWVDNENWLTDAPLGEWYGVRTDGRGRVIALDLRGEWDATGREWVSFGLHGRIPPELGLLAKLQFLDVSINALWGLIPPALASLQSLEVLDMSYNGLIGPIPPELATLTALKSLDLRRNRLAEPIPPEFGDLANLEELNLSHNELTGRIPPAIGGLVGLHYLDLSFNGLMGAIPPTFGNLTKLDGLDLYNNRLTGAIPAELANLDGLRSLWLGWNVLTGPIPQWLGDLTNLWSLNLQSNEHVGSIPPELGNLTNLNFLNLSGNALVGSIPPGLGNLTQLRAIDLSGNKLTGTLPISFLNLQKLETLGCARTEGVCAPATNEFREWERQIKSRGNITDIFDVPYCDEIDKVALRSLSDAANGSGWVHSEGWLADENLDRWHGVRTDSIGRVSGLDLSRNGLSGYLPAQIGLLANLTELKIGDNALSGQLPLSLARLSLEEFDYTGTSLCVPDGTGFRDWLNGIPRHNGTGVQCSSAHRTRHTRTLLRERGRTQLERERRVAH